MCKYRVLSGPYFPAFGLNTERYGVSQYLSIFSPKVRKDGPEKTPYLDTFHAVNIYKLSAQKQSPTIVLGKGFS